MRNNISVLKKIILSAFSLIVLVPSMLYAACPVCVVAVGAGLSGARMLGIDDIITGVWAGGLILALFFWTAGWLKKKGVKKFVWYATVPLVVYYAFLWMVYLIPGFNFGELTLWGIDKFFFGTIVGTIAFYVSMRWYEKIKRENNGRAQFPFQRIVLSLFMLLFATAIFGIIVYI